MEAFTLLHADPTQAGHGRTLFGTLAQHKAALQTYNELGFNVFFTVNITDGRGRRRENITKTRSVFADYDAGLPKQWALEPSMLVCSSPGRYQAYWNVDGWPSDFARWARIERALVMGTGADANAQDLARIFRVPGFLNHKYEPPHKVSVIEWNVRAYNLVELAEAFGEAEEPVGYAVTAPSEAAWPAAAVRLKRWKAWLGAVLDKQGWPGPGQRNGTLFNYACMGVREFAVSEDDVVDTLEDLWWEHEQSGDGRIEQLVQNALRSGRSAFGAAYAGAAFQFEDGDTQI